MCGIAGAVDRDERRASTRVRLLNDLQAHRGPDHSALVRAGSFTLGNTRLAIQDPSPVGNQPFRSHDGRFVCVFNGEIYNHRQLASRYSLKLSTQCDGAVIPEVWARLGPDCLLQFRGMYAIAIVDLLEDTLTVCRDPFGIKPLYYRRLADGAVVFGSEVRPLAGLETQLGISASAVASYLHLGAVPADQSAFEGLSSVPPNGTVVFSRDGRATESRIVPGAHPLSQPMAGEEVAALGPAFVDSVDVHLRSDVPSALLLSSGVDSAAIAAAARRLGRTLHCLTVAGSGRADEVSGAATTAGRYGHEHKVVASHLEATDVAPFFDAMQKPTVDGLNNFIVCRAVQEQGFRVALSGLGGDEALGGYPQFRVLPWLRLLRPFARLPQDLGALGDKFLRDRRREKLSRLVQRSGPRSAAQLDRLQRELFPSSTVKALTGLAPDDPTPDSDCSLSFRALVEAELRNYLQPMLLADSDAFSMCSSVELRVPFVDRQLFLAALVPVSDGRRAPGKRALADALNDPYLRYLVRQRKRGFTVSTAAWMGDGVLREHADMLDDASAPIWKVLDRTVGEGIVRGRAADRWQERWALTALNGWLTSVGRGARFNSGS